MAASRRAVKRRTTPPRTQSLCRRQRMAHAERTLARTDRLSRKLRSSALERSRLTDRPVGANVRLALDTFISVDVEASGPIPGDFSLLSIGACLVRDVSQRFYVELKPITRNYDPEALRVAALDLDVLARDGVAPAEAMTAFEAWMSTAVPSGHRPVFVAYPLAFDWMFVAYYFHRFLKRNPFGVTGLDLTSFSAGAANRGPTPWTFDDLDQKLEAPLALTHNALDDAIAQAVVFEQLLADRRAIGP